MTYKETLQALLQGKTCVYPTETFYALGCLSHKTQAVAEVVRAKQRPPKKGLPVIIGAYEQLSMIANLNARTESAWPPDLLQELVRRFWPGSLTLIFPAQEDLAPEISAGTGSVAVRMTPHLIARQLCLDTNSPLIATSANLAGLPPTALPQNLDPRVLDKCAGLLNQRPYPKGGLASTLVSYAGNEPTHKSLRVLRQGAISTQLLEDIGFTTIT